MNWLKEARQQKKLSQDKVAREVNVTSRYYQYIEKGTYKPSVDLAKRIGQLLEVDWTLFFTGDQHEEA